MTTEAEVKDFLGTTELEKLKPTLDQLTYRERETLKLRYGIGCPKRTLLETGKAFRVTRERVRQIEAKAIRKLQRPELWTQVAATMPPEYQI